MKIKNVSGATLTFKVGKRTHSLASNATTTVDETADALSDVIREVEGGNLELVGVPAIAHYAGTPARAGYVAVDLNTVVDTNSITIAGEVFEMDDNDTVTGDNTAVDISTGSPTHATIASRLKTAINANSVLSAIGLVADDIITLSSTNAKLILKATGATAIGDITITKSGSPITLATAVAAADGAGYRAVVVKATSAGTTLLLSTGLEEIYDAFVVVRTAAGARKAYDGAVTIGNGFLFFDASGSTDLANTDVVTAFVVGK
jgi:hypothetical protein